MLTDKIKEITKNTGFKKYYRNTGWLFGQKVLDMTINLFLSIWIIRYLGPTDFGILSYSISIVSIFSSFVGLGLDTILVKELVNKSSHENKILGSAFLLRIVSASVSLILIFIYIYLQEANKASIIIFIISFGVIIRSFNIIEFYFQSKVLSKYVAFAKSISLLSASIVKVILLVNELSLIYFAQVFIFEILVFVIFLTYFYSNHGKSSRSIFKWRVVFKECESLLKKSWPLMLAGIVITIYMKIDQIMINNIMGSEFVGYYAAASKLSEIWYFIPVIITSSLFPALIKAKISCKLLYELRLKRLYCFLIWLAFFVAFFTTLISDVLIDFLYGKEYLYTSDVLKIHIWTSVFVFAGVASDKWLVNEGLQIYSLRNCLIGAIINIILNFILITEYGVIGAAYATLISQAIASYFLLLISKKTRINFINLTCSVLFNKLI